MSDALSLTWPRQSTVRQLLVLLGCSASIGTPLLSFGQSFCLSGHSTVVIVNAQTDQVITTVDVDRFPEGVAITPDGSRAYVTCACDSTVVVVSLSTFTRIATIQIPPDLQATPQGIAFTPDGTRAFVAAQQVFVLDTDPTSPTYNGPPIASIDVGSTAYHVAIRGPRGYVTTNAGTVAAIDTISNSVVRPPTPIPVQANPLGVDMTPNGIFAFVANNFNDSETRIDTNPFSATYGTPASPVHLQRHPEGVAVTSDGTRAYITNEADDINPSSVSVVDTASNTVIGNPIQDSQMVNPEKIAITPNGKRAFVTNEGSGVVSVIDTDRTSATYNQVVDTITDPRLGSPEGVAVNPCGTLAVITNEQVFPDGPSIRRNAK